MGFAAEDLADRVRALLPGRLDVREQRMFGGGVFMLNGHMLVAPLKDGGLMVRVGPDGQAEALTLPGAEPMTMTGRTMKGFVVVSGDALEDDEALEGWIGRAKRFVDTLAPK
jgi:hypothetical protein